MERRRKSRRETDRLLGGAQRELAAARRISEVLFESPHSDEVIVRALDAAVEVVDAEGGSILIASPDTGELVFQHSIGIRPVPVGTAIPWDKGIAGLVFKSGEPVIIDDVTRDSRHFKGIDRLTDFLTKDMIATPLRRWNGETIGVLEVLNKRGGRFDENDLQLLLIVSAISASAIERARLNEEAKLAEVAKLFGDISHDIKNLLTPMAFGAELIAEVLDNLFARLAEGERESVGRRYHSCRKLISSLEISSNRIQERLKEFSDCIIGISTEPVFASCRLGNVVDEVFEALRAPAQQRGIALVSQGLEPLPALMADDGRLFNAFYNLVNNAIPEVPAGGSITISGERDPRHSGVLVSVADTGRGMPAEVSAALFTAHAKSRKRLGSGLGIRIVKDVVDAHNGRIEVESAPGAGTTFRIFLPLNQPVASRDTGNPPTARPELPG
jgi:signal transduction histidine kinase